MIGVLWLGGFVLMLNLGLLIFSLPRLLNSLLGIETVLDESVGTWNNSSFYLCIFVFSYLLINPLNKAVFALRCFYGRSRTSGADLRAELRRDSPLVPLARVVTVSVLLVVVLPARANDPANLPPPSAYLPVPVATNPLPSAAPAASPENLNSAIDHTLQKDEFAWRMPRAEEPGARDNLFIRLLHRFGTYLESWMDSIGKVIGKILDWLFKNQREHDPTESSGVSIAGFPWRALVVFLGLVALGCLLWLALRYWRGSRMKTAQVLRTVTPVRSVDLEDETVQADQLPEDSWLALAQELIEKGELRLALRALYLATLSALARQELVRLAATKSNRDYLSELTRRLRGETTIVPFFRENVRLFEASWYGTHDVTTAVIDAMRDNQQQVRGHVAA
jgi:hypothetical protein